MRRTLQLALPKSSAVAAGALTGAVATHSVGTERRRGSKRMQDTLQRDKRKLRASKRVRLVHEKTAAMKEELQATTNARDIHMVQLADQVFSRGHEYHSAACNVTYVPDGNPATPEVAMVGRSSVGKSSLLRALFRESRAVGRGSAPTRRDAVNFYSVGGGVFNIANTPGLGGVSVPWSTMLQSAVLIRNFARCRPNLKMIYYCMDVNPKYGVYIQDLDFLKFMSTEVPNFTIILTKGDRLPIAERSRDTGLFTVQDVRKELQRNDIEHPMLVTSAYEMGGIDSLRFDMVMNVAHSLPTERLSLTEVRRLSDRILTQDEIASVRPTLSLPPSDVHDQLQAWNADLLEERRAALPLEVPTPPSAATSSSTTATCEGGDEGASTIQHSRIEGTTTTAMVAAENATATSSSYQRVLQKLANEGMLKDVYHTSPWRNPLLWPASIVPTKHPRKNIMRCPGDPNNPYLTQAHFVAPRADMYFRRPNVGCRGHNQKGRYEIGDDLKANQRYAIPHFPDIVDVKMFPLPWMFLGSKDAYYEVPGGRTLGIRLARHALEGQVDALSDNPAPHDPALAAELNALQHTRTAVGTEVETLSLPLGSTPSSSRADGVGESEGHSGRSAPGATVALDLGSEAAAQRPVSRLPPIRHLTPRD